MASDHPRTYNCAMELEVANFLAISPQSSSMSLQERCPHPWVTNRSNICELSSRAVLRAGTCQFGLVLSWQLQEDGSLDPSSNLALGVWRDDADGESEVSAVRAVVALINEDKSANVVRDGLAGLKHGRFDGWWLDEVTMSSILDPQKGWLHDGSLIVKCELVVEVKQALHTRFGVGDLVRLKEDVRSPRYGWGDMNRGMVGAVIELQSDTKMFVEFPGLHRRRWIADPSEMELSPKIKSKPHANSSPKVELFEASQIVFQELLVAGELCDVVIETAGEEINAHAVSLAAGCPVFRKMLLSSMKEGVFRRVNLQHFPEMPVRHMISFIYTHDVPPTVQEDEDMLFQLLDLASYFRLPLLAKKCLEASASHLQVGTMFDRLGSANMIAGDADMHEHCVNYQAQCVSFILTHRAEIEKGTSWGDLVVSDSDMLCVVDGSGKPVESKIESAVLEFQTAFMKEVLSLVAPHGQQELELCRELRPRVVARRALDSPKEDHQAEEEAERHQEELLEHEVKPSKKKKKSAKKQHVSEKVATKMYTNVEKEPVIPAPVCLRPECAKPSWNGSTREFCSKTCKRAMQEEADRQAEEEAERCQEALLRMFEHEVTPSKKKKKRTKKQHSSEMVNAGMAKSDLPNMKQRWADDPLDDDDWVFPWMFQ